MIVPLINLERFRKMIRPELHTFKWSPKTKSKEDLKLVKDLEQLLKDLDLSKTALTQLALIRLVKYHNFTVCVFSCSS